MKYIESLKEAVDLAKMLGNEIKDETKVYDTLYSIASFFHLNPQITPPLEVVEVFENYVNSPNSFYQEVSLYGILMVFQIKKYSPLAIQLSINEDEEYEIRAYCISGLGIMYNNTKDEDIMKSLYGIMTNTADKDIIFISYRSLFKVYDGSRVNNDNGKDKTSDEIQKILLESKELMLALDLIE